MLSPFLDRGTWGLPYQNTHALGKRSCTLDSGRKKGRSINSFFQVINCYGDILISSRGNRGRPNKINAHDIERFVGSREVALKTGMDPGIVFKYNSVVLDLIYGITNALLVAEGFEPLKII